MTNKYLEKISKDTGKSIITGAILGGTYGLLDDKKGAPLSKRLKSVLRSAAVGAAGSGVASVIYNKLPSNMLERGIAKVKQAVKPK